MFEKNNQKYLKTKGLLTVIMPLKKDKNHFYLKKSIHDLIFEKVELQE